METKPNYKQTKNYIHNELAINKEYIENLTKEYIRKIVEEQVSQMLDSNHIQNLITRTIGMVLKNKTYYSHTDNEGIDYVKEVINKIVKEEVTKRIIFTSIDINLNK